ncbi:MAG: selenide, water dikinase SelD [Helicobacteraceae bacterium]|jgi:selenide,water dikinase|nr:selenide, water dikinase SelD [Helicobacteraceae bacterium]
MGLEDLTNILPKLAIKSDDPNVLVGIGDDAGVFRLSENIAIVQTADFITPIVDNPLDFGRIAAANALSDVFAMGGEAKTALALVMHDGANVPFDALREILEGGYEKIKESGAILLGGHTVNDLEMKYGLSVTGVVDPNRIWRNQGAQKGDRLILTKPLGMGIITTAGKADMVTKVALKEAIAFMSRLNLYAARSAGAYDVRACADITGFGLMGHALEMIRDEISFEIEWQKTPYLRAALSFASIGIAPGGTLANREFAKPNVRFEKALKTEEELILFDAQTSGGLLLAVADNQAQRCLDAIKKAGDESAAIIGNVRDRGKAQIIVG